MRAFAEEQRYTNGIHVPQEVEKALGKGLEMEMNKYPFSYTVEVLLNIKAN